MGDELRSLIGQALAYSVTTGGAFDTTKGGSNSTSDAFVLKLNADGTAVVYSTLLGGDGPSAHDLASRIGTISYELLVGIGGRVPRVVRA